MRIGLQTWGSEGDCRPLLHLAAGLAQAGHEVAAVWGDASAFAAINDKYALDMRFESVPELCERFGLAFPDPSDS